MTTININKLLLEQALNALLLPCDRWNKQQFLIVKGAIESLNAALVAPAAAPEFPADWAQMIHYPECWDTAAYPELRDAIHEALAWSGCSVCKPATAPAWHVAPTVPGLWVSDFSWMAQKLDRETVEFYAKNRSIPSRRWYGPIPEDKP
jgi:predicted NAD/FAD-dependent oxidoreductase